MARYLLGFRSTLFFVLLVPSVLLADTMAFFGDSLSTGAFSHPGLSFDSEALAKVFEGEQPLAPDPLAYSSFEADWSKNLDPEQGPMRLPLSIRDASGPLSWVVDKAFHNFSHHYLDTEEYSWAYLMGRKRALPAKDIMIAAWDLDRSETASRQVDRLLDSNGSQAVHHAFFFFTGNDLCNPLKGAASSAEDYAADLEKAIKYYVRNAKEPEETSYIWLVNPLSLLQIVTDSAILNHRVRAFGQDMSCLDLQSGRYRPKSADTVTANPNMAILSQLLNSGPRLYCPVLMGVHDAQSTELVLRLGSVLGSYRQQIEKLAKNLDTLHPKFRVRQLKSPSELAFNGDDMANDCFHFSVNGQLKIAKAIDAEMQTLMP